MKDIKFRSVILLFLVVSGISLFASFPYKVKGEIKGQDGRTVKMSDYGRNSQVIDSATVENGIFVMEGEYDRHGFIRVECVREFYSNGILDTLVVLNFTTHLPEPSTTLNNELVAYLEREDSYMVEIGRYLDDLSSQNLSEDEAQSKFNEYFETRKPELFDFYTSIIEGNPNGIGEAALWFGLTGLDLTPSQWDMFYSLAPEEIRSLPTTQVINDRFQTMKKTLPGVMFIDVEGKAADGSTTRLSDYVGKGKYVLVDFWASWCGPCIEEGKNYLMPLYEKYKDLENFEIVGVATWDDIEKTKQQIERQGYKWAQILDAGQQPMERYGFDGIPMIMLFGPDGTMLERGIRGPEIEKSIQKYVLSEK